ncbi:helix-turn-helix domain-containing protein [Parabacteroides chongii]|uniref:helix-turn-helix domain-containing protein n=1 Tax=Parabacteroides chongii TaxID=2685834 RepID=UPI00240DF859|nr:AraC family transcriptional regulator [Parabacteroides chongii]WFE83100.1 AraC family transcriptional regulator [Parabacteroides chongii]
MSELFKANNINLYNDWAGVETQNPLVGFIDFSTVKPLRHVRKVYGFYAVFLKDQKCGEVRYGRRYYDYQNGTLIFIAPGQVFGAEDDGMEFQPEGYLLMFHPDLLRNTPLGRMMDEYSFFSYEINEALHISTVERQIIMDCFKKIQYELNHPIDRHSKNLITDNIKTFLDYCTRFYDRQFITRDNHNHDVLTRFERLINDYFNDGTAKQIGLPTVQYCADKLNLSPNYFSDLLKKETGFTPLRFIHNKAIEIAKTELVSTECTINEIAYNLGFQYPQHFTRLFKKEVGCTPNEYRIQLS